MGELLRRQRHSLHATNCPSRKHVHPTGWMDAAEVAGGRPSCYYCPTPEVANRTMAGPSTSSTFTMIGGGGYQITHICTWPESAFRHLPQTARQRSRTTRTLLMKDNVIWPEPSLLLAHHGTGTRACNDGEHKVWKRLLIFSTLRSWTSV